MFERIDHERLYEKIVRQLRGLIEEQKINPGDKLPGERGLAKKLGCSRTSLREAFRVLESEGLVISKPGGGRFVQEISKTVFPNYHFNSIDLIEKTSILYFIEAREVLEPKIVEIATERATDEQINNIENSLILMERNFKKSESIGKEDTNFHLSIAEATNNFVFVSMMEVNLNMIRQVRRKTLQNSERYQSSLDEHISIFNSIKDRNVDKAVKSMRLHLQSLRENVLKEHQ